ncbi:MAG TPA: hypothetical protein VLX92_03460 [Kofleriaceae bacterium]|nr:hypothetical protein [Kofleriaceae bacterium]
MKLPSVRLLLLCAVSGCATPYLLRPGDVAPLTASVAQDQRAVVWQRAIGALLDMGYIPQVLNEAACYISAKQRDDVTDGQLAGTIAIVNVSPEGQVRVEVGGAGVYHSADELARDVKTVEHNIMQAILARSAPPAAAVPSS